MRFPADIGISQSTVLWLRKNGHDAIHLREQGLQKLPDPEIFEKASDKNRVILTCDLDFAHILAASRGTLPSVILFRLDDERPENVNRRLTTVLAESLEAMEKGAIISVEQHRHRVRFLPIP